MVYEPGKEPEEYKKYLNLLLRELKEAFPDGLIVADMWNHSRWDKVTEYLFNSLEYDDNISFLNAYGYEVFGDLDTAPNSAAKARPVVQAPQPRESDQEEQTERPQEAMPKEQIQPNKVQSRSTSKSSKKQEKQFFLLLEICAIIGCIYCFLYAYNIPAFILLIAAIVIFPNINSSIKTDEEKKIIAKRIAKARKEGVAFCPKCGSTSLSANKQGFGVGKAVIGAKAVADPIGLVAGNIGKNKITVTCLNCGHKFRPGQF